MEISLPKVLYVYIEMLNTNANFFSWQEIQSIYLKFRQNGKIKQTENATFYMTLVACCYFSRETKIYTSNFLRPCLLSTYAYVCVGTHRPALNHKYM